MSIDLKSLVKNWDGKMYKVLVDGASCYGGDYQWSLPTKNKNGNWIPGDWTREIEGVKMCSWGWHLTTHYAHWSDHEGVEVYEAEGDVIAFDGYDKVVCSRVRLLSRVDSPFSDENWNSGNQNSGNQNSGNWNSGNENSGNENSGNRNSGNENSGDQDSGYSNSGNRNSGNENSGYDNSGNGNSGDGNSGNWNSGNWNSGNYNSGSWNSCSKSSGYLCNESPRVMIFNKPAPIGWDQEFPGWMYFQPLPEGYHASWQNAFKKANKNGVEELLALVEIDGKKYKLVEV